MAEITAAIVKELREKTGAGMMDCKKALAEAAGDIEKAIDWLRKKGLSAAAKKAGRIASQGLVALKVNGKKGAVVEVNSETDFVARNEMFQTFVASVADIALQGDADLEALKLAKHAASGKDVHICFNPVDFTFVDRKGTEPVPGISAYDMCRRLLIFCIILV